MSTLISRMFLIILPLLLWGCKQIDDIKPSKSTLQNLGYEYSAHAKDTYTLYRNSPIDVTMRIYIATFDSKEGYDDRLYNYENCQRARLAFQEDPTFSSARFFCESGKLRP